MAPDTKMYPALLVQRRSDVMGLDDVQRLGGAEMGTETKSARKEHEKWCEEKEARRDIHWSEYWMATTGLGPSSCSITKESTPHAHSTDTEAARDFMN